MKRAYLVGFGAMAFAAVACQLVVGIEPVEKVERDASVRDAPVDAGPRPPEPCVRVQPPPPTGKDDPGETLPPLYLAARTLSILGKDSTGGDLGFDLDDVCSCEKRPGTRHDGGASCKAKEVECDSDGGIDNKAAKLFKFFSSPVSGTVDDVVNNDIKDGRQGNLIYLAGWNGQPNDSDVDIGFMTSYGIVDPSGCGSGSGQNRYPPQWCGHDRWTYPRGVVYDTEARPQPLLRGKGYVTEGQLVSVEFTKVDLLFGSAPLVLVKPVMVGKLVKNGDGFFKLDGIVSGRIEIRMLLSGVGQFVAPTPVCEQPIFSEVRKTLCDAPDISSGEDFTGAACDAVSASVSFSAESAEFGGEADPPDAGNPCVPTGPEDPRYQCAAN